MPGLPEASSGNPVKSMPGGFPLFFDGRRQRVVTGDPWAYLAHLAVVKLPKAKETIALAYIAQGREFFEAAANPRLTSRPLLYYYAFLNLIKAALLIRGIPLPASARHGIADPRANSRKRLRLEGQYVVVSGKAPDHGEIFPEFLASLGVAHPAGSYRIIDLLRLIPNIHRTFTIVERCDPVFVPLSGIDVLYSQGTTWARLRLKSDDKDVRDCLSTLKSRRAFQQVLKQVRSQKEGELWFETATQAGYKRGLDGAISKLATSLRSIGLAPILTAQGFRFYFASVPPRDFVPYLGAAAGVIFYLGSVTRYKPDVFDKIVSGRHSWVIAEFLGSQPTQFLYCLASELAGVDVVRPYAVS